MEGNLDLREFINLKQLVCSNNKITSLNLRGLNKLELVYCSNNQLAGISLSENPKLIQIDCRDNKLTKLNLNGCDNLTSINCQDNQLINLNISNCPKLTWLECLNNPLTVENLNISNCPKLNKSNIKWTTQVQDWLDWNYPKETRKEVEKLDISGNLEGNLKLEGFFNLKTLFTRDNKLNNLDIRDCFSLEWLNCSNNLLVILDLSNNYQLTTIYCGNCKIKELKLSNYPKLKEFDCSNNYLTGLNWDAFNPETLERINVAGNNFKRDLNCFSKFINLKSLRIGDSYLIFSSSSRKDFCDNLFYGSLKPLENLTKLETLDIGNTDIDSGLEYLPNNIHTISCLVSREPATKVKILAKQIEPFGPSAYANLRSWKEVNKEKIQLFLVSDKLSELVENKIKNFFARWSKYLSKEQEMIKSQKWTDYCWRFKWTSVVGGLVSSSLSLNANLLEQSAGFALGGIALGALGDYGVKKTEKKIKELESILNIKEEEFKQEIKMLKKNYNELLEIWRELSILSRTPTNFESTDSAFNEFLSVIAELKNQTRPSFHKQLSNDEIVLDVFDETEQTLEEIKKNKEFAQSLLVNWNKCQVSKSTTNLIQEINNYRQEFYDRNSTGELGKNIYSAPFILTTPVLDSQNWQPEPGSPLFLSKPGNEVYTYSRTQNRNIPLQILEWGDWKDLQKFKSDHQNKSVKLEKVPPSPLLFNSGQQISQEIKEKANTERQSVELPNISSKFTSQLVTQLQNLNFASDLITHWTTLNFTPPQVKDWLSIGLQPTDSHLAAWLRDELRLTPEQLLNDHTTNLADLREQFTEYQTYQEQPPKN